MPLPYEQNKQHIYKWVENNPEKHLKQNRKNASVFYNKNKEIINMTIKAKRKYRVEFFCIIYSNLYEY